MRVLAGTRAGEAACPACGTVSRRVHSRYQRQLADTAVAGREMLIHLQVRRFFCGSGGCAKTTFAEQVPGLTIRYGRRTRGLDQMLQAVVFHSDHLELSEQFDATSSSGYFRSAGMTLHPSRDQSLQDSRGGPAGVIGACS